MCKVSIIMPFYNVEKTIKTSIQSVLNQDFPDFELLLIDDGSIDGSAKICASFEDSRIQYIHLEHLGVSNARNKGLALAKGDYVSFMDSDDIMHSRFISTMYHNILSTKSDIVVCGYNTVKQLTTTPVIYQGEPIINSDALLYHIYTNESIGGFLWNKMYRRTIFLNKNFRLRITHCEDMLFNTELLLNTSLKVTVISDVLYDYYITQDSVTSPDKLFHPDGDFVYHNAFQEMLNELIKTDNRRFIHPLMYKYSTILEYSMYYLMTHEGDYQKLIPYFKEIKKYIWSNHIKSFRQKLHFAFLTYMPNYYKATRL